MVKVIIDEIEIEDLSEIEAPEETVEIIKSEIFVERKRRIVLECVER